MGEGMVWGAVIFFKYRTMTDAEVNKARKEWEDFKKALPRGVKIIAEYDHAHGTDWNGFLLVEARTMDAFQEFWESFRDLTRWYVDRTHAIIGVKR